MIQNNFEKMIPLINKRLYKGGRVGNLWFIFRKNELSGIFQIAGYGLECVFVLKNGKVIKFTVQDQLGTWTGDEAMTRFKYLVRRSNVRFSIYVTP